MKKMIIAGLVLMALFVIGCDDGDDEKDIVIKNKTTVVGDQGLEYYINNPKCFVDCPRLGYEYIVCRTEDNVAYLRLTAWRPNGVCGCAPDIYDCGWWNGN